MTISFVRDFVERKREEADVKNVCNNIEADIHRLFLIQDSLKPV